MHNIIANSCIGGYIYRNLGEPFRNPFTWAMIRSQSFIQLIRTYDIIDWDNIELLWDTDNPLKDRKTYKLCVDKQFMLHYTHYLDDERFETPLKDGVDIRYNRITDYIIEKYTSRVRRMLSDSINPIFLILCSEYKRYDYTLDNQIKLCEKTQDSSYIKIIITKYKELLRFQDTNTIIFITEFEPNIPPHNTEWFANTYFPDIMSALKQRGIHD